MALPRYSSESLLSPADKRFYGRLALVSAVAFTAAGYLTLFSIGLGLLVLALVSAVLGAALLPGVSSVLLATIVCALAALPWVVLLLRAG